MSVMGEIIEHAARNIEVRARLGADTNAGALEMLVALVNEYFTAQTALALYPESDEPGWKPGGYEMACNRAIAARDALRAAVAL